MAIEIEDYGRAVQLADQELKKDPGNMAVRLKLTKALRNLPDYDRAEAELNEILRLDPSRKETLGELADVAIMSALDIASRGASPEDVEIQWAKARDQINYADTAGAPPAMVHFYLGRYYRLRDDIDAAIREYELSAKTDTLYIPPHEELYELYLGMYGLERNDEDLEKAKSHAEAVIEIDDTDLNAGLTLARVLRIQRQIDASNDRLLSLVQTYPKDWQVHAELSLNSLTEQKLDKAFEHADKSLKLNSAALMPRFVKGAYYLSRGDNQDAVRYFHEVAAQERPPQLAAEASAKEALAQMNLEHNELARAACLRAIRLQPTQTEARFYLAQIHYEEQSYDEAATRLEEILDISPRNTQAMAFLVRTYMSSGQTDRAQALRRELEEEGTTIVDEAPLIQKATIQLLRKDYVGAEETARIAVETFDDMAGHRVLGQALQGQDKIDEAIEEFQKMLQIDEDSVEPYILMCAAYSQSKQEERAVEALQTAIELMPNASQPYYFFSQIREEQGNLEEAVMLMEKYRELEPDAKTGYELARLYVMQGKLEEARELWLKAQEENPREPRFLASLGITYQLQGEYNKAAEALDSAISERPTEVGYIIMWCSAKLAAGENDQAEERIRQLKISKDRLDDYLSLVDFAREKPVEATEVANSLNMAQLYANSRRFDLAVSECDKATEILGDVSVAPLFLKADIHSAANDEESSIKTLQEIVAKRPQAMSAWTSLALVRLRESKYDEAIAAAQKANAVDAEAVQPLLIMAESTLNMGSREEAVDHAQSVLDLRPEPAEAVRAWQIIARARVRDGRMREADEAFQAIKRLQPDSPMVKLMTAQEKLARKDVVQAELIAREVLEASPCNPRALVILADTLFLQANADQAILTLKQATECEPNYVPAHQALSRMLERIGNFRKAEETCRKALQRQPDSVPLHLQLGLRLMRDDKLEEALAEFRKAMEILAERYPNELDSRGDYRTAASREVQALYQLDRHDEAMKASRDLVEARPEDTVVRVLIAALQKKKGNYDEAIIQLEKILEEKPNYAPAYELATFYFNKGQFSQSANVLEDAIREYGSPEGRRSGTLFNHFLFQIRLAIARQFDKNMEEAFAATEKAKAEDPNNRNPLVQIVRINMFIEKGEFDRAREVAASISSYGEGSDTLMRSASKYIDTCEERPDGKELASEFNEALFYHVSSWPPKAIALFERLLDKLPDDLLLIHHYGDALRSGISLKDADKKAVDVYKKMIEIEPGLRSAYLNLARLQENSGDRDGALKTYGKGLARIPGDSDLLLMKAMALEKAEDYDAALELYNSIIESDVSPTKQWTALNNAAWLYAVRKNDLAKGRELAEKARDATPEAANGHVLDTLGWIAHLQGKNDEAVGHLERAVSRLSSNPRARYAIASVRYHLGAVYADHGETGKALYQLTTALDIDPDFDYAKEAKALVEKLRQPVR